MKNKLLALSVLSLALTSGSAMANAGNIQFIGSVSTKTCDIVTDVAGANGSVIQLGTAAASTAATAVPFALKLKDANCDLTGLTNADITFGSASLSTTGLANNGGTATGAWVKLSSVNAATPSDITSSNR
ncbi:MAG: hypothetical protein RR676_14615, partial [Acinetobacter sp.]